MHHLITDTGERIFPQGMRLLSHWNLRDEIKAQYSNGEKGLEQQRMIRKVMEQELDKITHEKYPDANAYAKDMPRMLVDLGFSEEKAGYLTDRITVDPARGSGHAWGAQMRGAKAHLRTRFGKEGMDYKGYNVAVHEMGHNVEQTFSLYDVDYYLLNGVPNTAFTEAIAFLFQNRDLELFGLSKEDEKTTALKNLDQFLGMYELAGVALVDMAVWHWMYDNPDATPAQLKEAVLKYAKDVWNKYYAPVVG